MKKLLIVLLFALPGASALAQLSLPKAPATTPGPSAALPPGLYVQVIDGLINVSNRGGAQTFAAGQFGYTATPVQPPVIVPRNPGLLFTPPPVFNSGSPTVTSTAPKSNAVDCEVR